MITVTNKKVAGLEPLWAPFRGFSLLFDNPGESISPMVKGLGRVDCSVDTNPSLQLYKELADSLDKIGRDLLTNTYSFCPLPSHSYHVTVWDGLNDGNAKDVFHQCHPDAENFLAGLPRSLLTDQTFTGESDDSPLLGREDWAIKFRFDRLFKWGNQVLVAHLVPADQDSERELEAVIQDRQSLTARFRERFGIETITNYSPHISLGYFANARYAESATPQIDRWTDSVTEETGDLTIAFTSISLYGFTDMVTFFKNWKADIEDNQ